jgi:hypothetical protein
MVLHAIRVGVDPAVAIPNVKRWMRIVGAAENNGKTTGFNVPQKGKEPSGAIGSRLAWHKIADAIETGFLLIIRKVKGCRLEGRPYISLVFLTVAC